MLGYAILRTVRDLFQELWWKNRPGVGVIFLLFSFIFSPMNTFRYFSLRRYMRALNRQWNLVMSSNNKAYIDLFQAQWITTGSALQSVRRGVSTELLEWVESTDEHPL